MKTLLTILLVFPLAVSAQEEVEQGEPLRLDEYLARVEQSFPELRGLESRILAARARSEGARSWMPPVFSAGLDRFPYRTGILREDGPMNQAAVMFSLEQMIPNPKKLDAREAYLSSLGEPTSLKIADRKAWLRKEAITAYLQKANAVRKVKLLEEQLKATTLLLEATEAKLPFNAAQPADIYKLKARQGEVESMLVMARNEERMADAMINIFLFNDPDATVSVDTSVTISPPAVPLDSASIAQRPELLAIQSRIRSMELQRNLMAADRLPDFGIRLQHMQMLGMPPSFSVMGMITLPFVPWSSGMYKSEIRAMDQEIASMEDERSTMQLMATERITSARIMANALDERLKIYQGTILPALRKNFEAELLSYSQNTGSFFVLIESWEMLLMKELEMIGLSFERDRALADLEYETTREEP